MLQSLDTLIAFVLIMTVASLFVTILVQMCSAALSLRGKNLANALALSFQAIAPALREDAHPLAARILCDPLLSDSTRTEKDLHLDLPAPEQKRPWVFTDLFGATRLASAVRPEEVFLALKRIALSRAQKAEGKAAAQVLEALVVPAEEVAAIRAHLAGFVALAGEISDEALRQKLLQAVEDTPAHLLVTTQAARAAFDGWFRTAQDRAQQWFQLHTRGLTIGGSILVALFLQLDAVEIFHYASTNAAGRGALVARAEQIIAQAGGAWDERGGLLAQVAEAWSRRTGHPAVDLAGIVHIGQLQEKLAREEADFDAEEFARVLAATTREYYRARREELAEMTREVSATGFEFLPRAYWRWPSDATLGARLSVLSQHLPGMALCAALLTLGAPYWYNLLKNLTSLRPALAQLIGKEQTPRDNSRS